MSFTTKETSEIDVEHVKLVQVKVDCKLQVSPEPLTAESSSSSNLSSPLPPQTSLLATSSKYGYCVIGAPSDGFSILRTRDIVNLMTKSDKNSVIPLSKLDGGEGSLPPQRVVVRVAPKHLPLISLRISPANQDNILIATSAGSLLLYKAHHLWKQGPRQGQGQGGTTHSIEPPFKIFDLLLDHSSSFSIYDFAPNPEAFPDICAVLFSSGSLSLVNLDSGSISSTSTNITDPQHPLYAAAGQDGGNGVISAINWSKKGKQLAVGTKSGSILQITPDDAFTVKNEIPPPPSEDAIPVSYLNWIEAKLFLALYSNNDLNDLKVSSYSISQDGSNPKNTVYNKLELDPCFTTNYDNGFFYHADYIPSWGNDLDYFFIVANTASSDVDVLGAVKQDTSSSSWANIQLPELCKPAIPLRNLDSSDNRPLGIAIDFSNDITVPPASPDDPQLAAGPVLLVLLDEGCLIAYHCLNVRPNEKCAVMCIAEHLPDLFSAAPPPAAISLAPNLPITADKNQAAALPPPPGFSFPGFGGTSSSSAPPTLFGQVASAAKPATTTSKRTPNATATTNALPPSAPSAMPLLFPSTAPSPSSFSSGNLAVPAALSANSVGASLFSPPPVSNGKLAPPAVKTAESVLQLGKNSTVADSSVTIEASKGTQLLVNKFDELYTEFEEDLATLKTHISSLATRISESKKSKFKATEVAKDKLSTPADQWCLGDLLLIGRACTELSAESVALSATFSTAQEKRTDFLNAMTKAHTKSVHIQKCIEFIEKRDNEGELGIFQGGGLGPENDALRSKIMVKKKQLENGLAMLSEYLESQKENSQSSKLKPPTWEQIRRSITRITKHTLSISSKLNDLNDLVKAIKISEYSTADGQQPALSAILSTPEKQPANVAAPSKSSATTSRRKGGFGLMDGEEESPDILQLIAPSMKSPKKDQQESRSNLIAQLKENLSKPDRKALINRTAINPPPIIASLIKKPLPVKEKKVLLPVASSMAPRATLLGQDARVAAPPATTRAATPSPVPASPPIVAAEPPKFAAPTIGPPATNFGLGAKPALTFASSSTTTISSGNGVLGAGATFGLSSAPPSSLFGTTSGKVTTAPLFDTSNATPDATKFGPPPIPFTATAPPPLLPKEEQPVAAKPNLFVFNNKPGTEVPSFGAPTTLAKDDKTETPTQSSFTNSSAPALILKNSDSSKPLKFGDATTAAATTTTPPDRGFFGATATLPSSNAASSSNAGPFGPIIPKPTPLFSEGAAKTTLPTSSTSALPAAVVPSSVAANTSLSFGSAPKQNGSTGLGSLATAPVAFAEFGLKVADSKSASTVKPSVSPTSAPSSPVKAPSSPQKIVHPKQSTAQSNLGDETLDNESVVAADQENTLKIGDLGAPSTAEVEEDEETEIPVSVNEEEQVLEDEYDEGGEAGEGEEEEFENRDDAYNRDDDDLDEAGDKPDSSFERDQDSPTSPSPPRPVAAATVAGSPVASSPIVVKSSIPAVPSTPPATTTSSSIFSTTAASKSPLKTASFLDPKPVSSSTEFRFGSSSMSSSTVASSTTSFGFGGSLSMTAAGASGGGTPVYGTTATFGSSIKPVAFDASAAAAFGKTFSGNNDVMKNGMRSDDESDNESKMSNDDDDDNHQQSSQRSQETSLGGLFGGSNMLGTSSINTTSNKPSVFGSFGTTTSSPSSQSVFNSGGSAVVNQQSAMKSAFGSGGGNSFGSTSIPSAFGGGSGASVPSAFGGASISSSSSVFGSSAPAPAFGASSFGSAAAKPPTATTSAFGATSFESAAATPPSTSSAAFGSSSFGSTSGMASSSVSTFGSSVKPSTSFGGGGIFGTPTAAATSAPAFGSTSFGSASAQPIAAFGSSGFGGVSLAFPAAYGGGPSPLSSFGSNNLANAASSLAASSGGFSSFGSGGNAPSFASLASQGASGNTSSFASAGSQQQQQVFGGGGSSVFGGQPQQDSVFGGNNNNQSAFGGGGGFGSSSTTSSSTPSSFGGSAFSGYR